MNFQESYVFYKVLLYFNQFEWTAFCSDVFQLCLSFPTVYLFNVPICPAGHLLHCLLCFLFLCVKVSKKTNPQIEQHYKQKRKYNQTHETHQACAVHLPQRLLSDVLGLFRPPGANPEVLQGRPETKK
jgi:hypothetical protein